MDTVSVKEKRGLEPAVEAVREALSGIEDPHMKKDLVAAGEVDEVIVDGDVARIRIVLGYPAASWTSLLKSLVQERAVSVEGIQNVEVAVETKIIGREITQKDVSPIDGVRNMIAVASGKGGVGKSTVSVNLALALAAEGSRVGILDADIYGPSQPRMLGIGGQPKSPDGKSLEPMISHQLQAMSIGFLIDEDTAMIWRGPMVTGALEQLLNDTLWDDLDYLVIDLPPGTGDIQLTLAQKVPVSGALIVTTPQDIALLDAKKAVKMFEKVRIPLLGIVENMSTHICSNCGYEEHIFGEGGGRRMASEYEIDYLGEIPLARSIREGTDSGKPTMVSEPDGQLADIYRTIARNVSGRLAARKRDYTDVFPSIVIQNS